MAFAGIKYPNVVASSLGLNALRIRPVLFASGFPAPARFSVSVPMFVHRWNVYLLRTYTPFSSNDGSDCVFRTSRTVLSAWSHRGVMNDVISVWR